MLYGVEKRIGKRLAGWEREGGIEGYVRAFNCLLFFVKRVFKSFKGAWVCEKAIT